MSTKELTLNEIQQCSFVVLKKIKEICDSNNIKYWLAYGTLIGAIRHKGFIPWDDDIDIQMPRDDYERFVDYCMANKDALKPYELFHYKTNKEYIYPIARFSDSRYHALYHNAKDYGLGVFVDIYPVDECDANSKKLHRKRLFYMTAINLSGYKKIDFNFSKNIIKNLVKLIVFPILRCFNTHKLIVKYDSLFKNNIFGEGNFSTYIWETRIYYLTKDLFDETIDVMFNGELFPAPKEYDAALKRIYGNYMELPPEEDRIPHHLYSIFQK